MSYIDVVAGTRPNLVKAAAVLNALREFGVSDKSVRFIYTAQHYDANLFGDTVLQLGLGQPNVVFEKPSPQDRVLESVYEQYSILLRTTPHPTITVVFGDVTSTLAVALAARFAGIPVAHVEGGLRSHNWSMPEEIIRVAVDAISTHAFVTTEAAGQNLRYHMNLSGRVFVVGNTMADSLLRYSDGRAAQAKQKAKPQVVVTLHRPSNVDDHKRLRDLVGLVCSMSKHFSIIFPVHPRTAAQLQSAGLELPENVGVPPIPYFDFLKVLVKTDVILTDSGGISEEATILGIPCITMRNETERPETVQIGTNVLVGDEIQAIPSLIQEAIAGRWKSSEVPPLWDGKAGERIVTKLHDLGFIK